MDGEATGQKIGDLSIRDYAMTSHGEYWHGKETELEALVNQISLEIAEIEKAATETYLPKTAEDAKRVKAVWTLSGSGTYNKPITDTPGDLPNADKPWAQSTDKKRIDHAVDLIKRISIIASGDYLPEDLDSYQISEKEIQELIKRYGPYLIYNGIPIQNSDLISAIEDGSLIFPKEKLFIPGGEIKRTVDQIRNLQLPDINIREGDSISVISHAPHLARVMRMINKFRSIPEEVDVRLDPLVFEDPENEREFANSETRGIVGYVASGLAMPESYPYKLSRDEKINENRRPDSEKKENPTVILPITSEDMIDVLALSNQDSVRANSIKSEKIDLEDHKKWFARKIEDENTIMLKSLTGNQFSGQVRLDIEGDTALIGVSVSEDFQGKGIGSDLLQAAIEKAKEQGLKAIEAFIKPENSGSRRLFEKNGWIFQEETETDGVRLLKYIYTIGKE